MAAATYFRSVTRRLNPVTGILVFSAAFGAACVERNVSAPHVDALGATFSATAKQTAPTTSVHWNEVARTLVASHNTNGPMASRVYALVSVAQFVAARIVDDADGRHEGGGRNADNRAALRAAITKASADVLTALYPDSESAIVIAGANTSAGGQQPVEIAPDGRQASRGHAIPGDVIGAAVARIVMSGAATDGSAAANCPATPPTPASQFWHDDAVPPNPQAQLPCFGNVRTWLQLDIKNFRTDPPPPPAFGSPAFLQGLAEVRQISDTRTAAQLATVDKWLDGNNSFTPAGRWNLIASDLIAGHNLSDADAARVFAVLNVAMMDTHVACWDRKFTYWESRPWMVDPLITTPRGQPHHPANPSGHACAGGAGSATLGGFFRAERDSLAALGDEEGFTTVQSGVHYRFDVDIGLRIGRTIAARALAVRNLDNIVEGLAQR